MLEPAYQPPVAKLLTFGDLNQMKLKSWPDYVTKLGFTAEHIPELLRMMSDRDLWEADSDSLEVWATAHAWRALAQLGAIEIIDSLLELFRDYEGDDWLNIDAPEAFARLGSAALPKLKEALADTSSTEYTRIAIAESIERLATREPDYRAECIQILIHQLEAYTDNGETLNGSIVSSLVELQVIEAADLIERVYQSGNIDDGFAGTWPRVQVDLGLKQESDFSEKDFQHKFYRNLQAAKLIRNPNYAEDLRPFFDRDFNSFNSSSAPLKFGKSELKIPKKSNSTSAGFGQSGKAKKKK